MKSLRTIFQSFVQNRPPKILAVGRNYAAHAKQMSSPMPTKPVIFLKASSSLLLNPSKVQFPFPQHQIHHQVELGVIVKEQIWRASKQQVQKKVGGYFLLIDFTDRTQQEDFKKKGLPWQLSKSQNGFLPITDFFEAQTHDPYAFQLQLKVNNVTKQKQMVDKMHFKIDEVLSFVSQYMTLQAGDMICMGTPEGVGPVRQGDFVEAFLTKQGKALKKLQFKIE